MSAAREVYIVSHTHWDREWYLPRHRFRVSLVRVLREVLEALEADNRYEHFMLDGQAILLEDYLEVMPQDADRIRRLVERGRLSIGPWYILPDEFLVSGEAHVRNLLYGRRVCRRFGAAQRVGYMPDSFGHIAQMPQLLRRAGLDAFVYTRGNGDEIARLGTEYRWRAPDGSEVLAVQQVGGYCNAGGLGYEEIWEAHTDREPDIARAVAQVGRLLEKMDRASSTSVRLLNNGCDHFPVQARFDAILTALESAYPQMRFHHTSLEAFVRALRAAGAPEQRHEGELLGGKHHPILSGVWSARMPLKQRNEEAQTLLEQVVEPAAAYMAFVHGRDVPRGLIDAAWKKLLENHPHDSICGCSTDEVHREMMPRFAGAIQSAEQLLVQFLNVLAPSFARHAADDERVTLLVFNPLPVRRTEVIERLVILPPGAATDDLELVDDRGGRMAFEVTAVEHVERFWGIDYRQELYSDRQQAAFDVYRKRFGARILKRGPEAQTADTYVWLRFVAADLPAVGARRIEVRHGSSRSDRARASDPGRARTVRRDGHRIENHAVQATLHPNGVIDLLDKTSGRLFPGLNLLEDVEDVGDEYDYGAAAQSETITSADAPGAVRVLWETPLSCALEAESRLVLPASIHSSRSRRARRRVACPFRVRIGLDAHRPWVDLQVWFDNRARDHRLRALFPTPIRSGEALSDGHFLINRRPIDRPAGADWVQPPPETMPQQGFCLLEDDRGGLAVFNRGLPEFAPLPPGRVSPGTALAVTLLRCVGWLSRDDFAERRYANAGPTLHTPEAQCLGPHTFRLGLYPFGGDHLAADVAGWSRRFRTAPIVKQGVGQGIGQGVGQGVDPAAIGLIEKAASPVLVTAVKPHAERATLVVRCVNLAAEPREEMLTFGPPVASAWRADLLEEREDALRVRHGHHLTVRLGAHEIGTFEIQFARS